jgi:hypothetical protein
MWAAPSGLSGLAVFVYCVQVYNNSCVGYFFHPSNLVGKI